MTTWVTPERTGRESVGTSLRVEGRDFSLSDVRPNGPASWCTSRYDLLWVYVSAQSWAPANLDARRKVCEWALAVWALESGYGRKEWNWDAGGIRCVSTSVKCVRLRDAHNPSQDHSLEAFDDAAAFVHRWWAVVRRSFPRVVEEIAADEATAFGTLYRLGYGSDEAARELPAVLAGVRRRLYLNDRGTGAGTDATDTEGEGTGATPENPTRTRPRRRGKGLAMLAAAAVALYALDGG